MRRIALLTIAVSVLIGCSQPASFPSGTWIDLSHDFSEDTIYWVTSEPFKRTTVAEGKTDKGFYYSATIFQGLNMGERI